MATFFYRPDHPRASLMGMVDARDLRPDERPAPQRMARSHVVSDLYMDGTRSPVDGSDIGTRARRREHMRLHGLADFDDYKNAWETTEKQRAAPDPTIRADVERAFHDVREKDYVPERAPLELKGAGKVVPPGAEDLF